MGKLKNRSITLYFWQMLTYFWLKVRKIILGRRWWDWLINSSHYCLWQNVLGILPWALFITSDQQWSSFNPSATAVSATEFFSIYGYKSFWKLITDFGNRWCKIQWQHVIACKNALLRRCKLVQCNRTWIIVIILFKRFLICLRIH